jgi:hypothetical protein
VLNATAPTKTCVIVSKRAPRQQEKLVAEGYTLIDVTSTSPSPELRKFSPFYPHGNIQVPGMDGVFSESVEGIWQGLKVFEHEGVDASKFRIKNMKNMKRPSGARRGKVLGHYSADAEPLAYLDARARIYIPVYRHMLETHMQDELRVLRGLLAQGKKLAFIDYETSADPNAYKPLSHASLVIAALHA